MNTRHKKGFSVAPSPFNPVKFDLGVVIILGICVFVIQEVLISDGNVQLGLLLAYGTIAALWLLVRIQRVKKQLLERQNDGDRPHGP